jgi:hypothetical protein
MVTYTLLPLIKYAESLLTVVTPTVGVLRTFGLMTAVGVAVLNWHNWYAEPTFTIRVLLSKDTKTPEDVPVHSEDCT